MTVTTDQLTDRYGTPDQATPIMAQPMTANTKVYAGTVAITRSGYVVASDSPLSTDVVWGIVSKQTDNTTATGFGGGGTGAVQCPIDRGAFWLNYTGAVTQANVGQVCYLSNATTVTLTQGSLPQAGYIQAIDTTISKVAVALASNNGVLF